MDLLRAFSITVVVLGHWLIAVIHWSDDRVSISSAIGITRGLWLLTWVLQVMPLFFFVGGFSNLKTWDATVRSGGSYLQFMRGRLARLLKPSAVFAAVWLVVQLLLHLFDTGGSGLIRPSAVPFGPLWFLVVYVGVVALVPVTTRLHRRFRGSFLFLLLLGVGLLDLVRFQPWNGPTNFVRPPGDLPPVVWLNVAFVWVLVHQIGYFYADGSLLRRDRKTFVWMAAGGLVGLVVLTNIGIYPRSMVGTDIERVSNMNPPTLAIVSLTVWLVGAAMFLRDRANRWLQETNPWSLVIAANSIIMTVFLWHLTAYLIAILVLYPLDLGAPEQTDATWWALRPVWVVVPAIVLAGLVAVFARFERPAR